MSQKESHSCMADQAPPLLESHFSTELHIYEPGDKDYPSESSPTPQSETPTPQKNTSTSQKNTPTPQEDIPDGIAVPQRVVLSTESRAALKVGSHQLIPKNLAVSSRPKNRHHTTVVTFPVGLENSSSGHHSRHSAEGPDVSWEDYDSDGDGLALRRNRRNKSYRAAVTSLDIEALAAKQATPAMLKPVHENRASSPGPARSPGRKVC